MKILLATLLFLPMISPTLHAAPKKAMCKKNLTDYSCAEVTGAKRMNFCHRTKKLDRKKVEKICKRAPKKMVSKKTKPRTQ